MSDQDRPTPALSGIVYGDIVYWGTALGAVISIVGTVLAFVTKSNYLPPGDMITGIWQEKPYNEIWASAVGSAPNGHWYLSHLGTGDGLACLGLSLGAFVVIPAMLASAYFLYKSKDVFFAWLAIAAAGITVVSMLGLLPLPVG